MRALGTVATALATAIMMALGAARAAPRDPVAEARALRETGRYAEARPKLEALAKADRAYEARYELGLLYRATGQRALERAVWNGFYDAYESGRLDKKSAHELTYLALAARLLGGTKDANDTFRDAVEADPKGKDGARANIEWARLFLEKYDAGHAEVCLDEALAIVPEDPVGRVLLARVKIEQTYDVPAALRELDRAEKRAPKLAEAEALRAQLALEGGQPERARAIARAILVEHGEDVPARTILAGAAILSDDRAGYDAERAHVLATNPLASQFFHEVGELLVRNHRYEDALAFEEEALRVDAKDAVARAAYGANLLRLGREKEGLEQLTTAWKGDRYNVRTFNLLNLFEDVIPKHYTFIDAPPFRIRVANDEKAIVAAEVVPLLQRARAALDKAYETKLGPVTIELYTDPKHYAVRTIGLPGLDAIGVTFGPVITAMSPSVGKFDWCMVLWHELSHVYAIRASRSRVPRWFTEGLSEYETTVADPTWTRRTSSELASALQRGALLPVAELDAAFLNARDVAHMVVAYHEASAAATYFAERAGRKGIRAALAGFAKGHELPRVIQDSTGEDIAEFDKGFRAWLHARLAIYDGQLLVGSSDYSDMDGLAERVHDHPEDTRARGLLALAHYRAGDLANAAKLAAGPSPSLEMRDAQVRVALAQKDHDGAERALRALRASGHGAEVELLAARVANSKKQSDVAWAALSAAALADPDSAEPYLLQAELAGSTPMPSPCGEARACAARALAKAVVLDVMSAGPAKKLFALRIALGDKDVAEAARRALEVVPFDGKLRLDYAAWLKTRDAAEAKRQTTLAKVCPPSDEKPE